MIYRIYLGHKLPNAPRILEFEIADEEEISPAEIIKDVKNSLSFAVDRVLILWPSNPVASNNEGDKEYA